MTGAITPATQGLEEVCRVHTCNKAAVIQPTHAVREQISTLITMHTIRATEGEASMLAASTDGHFDYALVVPRFVLKLHSSVFFSPPVTSSRHAVKPINPDLHSHA